MGNYRFLPVVIGQSGVVADDWGWDAELRGDLRPRHARRKGLAWSGSGSSCRSDFEVCAALDGMARVASVYGAAASGGRIETRSSKPWSSACSWDIASTNRTNPAGMARTDIRVISPTRVIDDRYANSYANSKWAGEVLLREAHDLCGLPVAVFRCDMILADTRYVGQLNVPAMFTRLMLSLVATGVAPGSFYELDANGNRARAHYDGLPVDFIAEAMATLGERVVDAFETYHVMNPYDDGIGLDEYVDWLIDAGYSIQRIPDYDTWLQRFETAIRALPEQQRQHSLPPLLHNYQRPEMPIRGSIAPTVRFRAAVQEAKFGPDKDIPHVSAPIIMKYVTDLQLFGLL